MKLKKFKLFLHDNRTLSLHDVKVVRSYERGCKFVRLEGNPVTITLVSDNNQIVASASFMSPTHVDQVPYFIKKLLA